MQTDPKTWSALAEHWLGFIQRDLGISLGVLVVIVAAAYFALKFVRAWRGK